jgi:hypothetical protein
MAPGSDAVDVGPVPPVHVARPSGYGAGRGMLSSVDEFLRRKHEEIEEEEQRRGR